MPCKIMVDSGLKEDILQFSAAACAEVYAFLLTLQEDPLPRDRIELAPNAFYFQLPSGCFIAWEILEEEEGRWTKHPKFSDLLTIHGSDRTLIRILGAGYAKPPSR